MNKGNEKMMKYRDKMKEWRKERDEVILSQDIRKFKEFHRKWYKEGVYDKMLPDNDMIIEISLRQALLGLDNIPEGKMIEAQLWLIEHGCSPYPWRS